MKILIANLQGMLVCFIWSNDGFITIVELIDFGTMYEMKILEKLEILFYYNTCQYAVGLFFCVGDHQATS